MEQLTKPARFLCRTMPVRKHLLLVFQDISLSVINRPQDLMRIKLNKSQTTEIMTAAKMLLDLKL